MGRHTVKQVFKKRLSFIDSSLGDAAFTAPAEQAKQAPVGPEECLPAPALPDRVSGFLLSFSSILRSFSSRASAPPAMSKRIFGRQAVSSAFFFLIFVTRASSGRRIYNSGAVVLVRLTTFIRFIPSFVGWRGGILRAVPPDSSRECRTKERGCRLRFRPLSSRSRAWEIKKEVEWGFCIRDLPSTSFVNNILEI